LVAAFGEEAGGDVDEGLAGGLGPPGAFFPFFPVWVPGLVFLLRPTVRFENLNRKGGLKNPPGATGGGGAGGGRPPPPDTERAPPRPFDAFTAHRNTVSTAPADLSYVSFGDGPVALFVHGIGTNSLLWRNVMALLPNRRCIAVDLPLHGHSPARRDQDLS